MERFSFPLFTITASTHPPMHAPEPSRTKLVAVALIQAWILIIFIGCPLMGLYLFAAGEKGYLKRLEKDTSQPVEQRELARRKIHFLEIKAAH